VADDGNFEASAEEERFLIDDAMVGVRMARVSRASGERLAYGSGESAAKLKSIPS
jgi:hypothetical protein